MPLIEYDDASPEVRAVYDDIMETRQVDWVNNFWKALAVDPISAAHRESVKEVMAPGASIRSRKSSSTSPSPSRTAVSTASPRTRPRRARRA